MVTTHCNIYTHKAPLNLDIYRPVALLNVICEIWERVFGNRLTPLLSLLTGGAQADYKPNRSTLDVISQIENGVKQSKTNQLILIDPSKAFGCIARWILWDILYEKKEMPWRYIIYLQQGHMGTQLRPKLDGQIGAKISNKGVSQGSPLSAQLFTIYFGAMLQEYDNSLHGQIRQTQQET